MRSKKILALLILLVVVLPFVVPTVKVNDEGQVSLIPNELIQEANAVSIKTNKVGTTTAKPVIPQPSTLGTVTAPAIQIYQDSNVFRLNNTMFIYEFYRGTAGYDKVLNKNGVVLVYDQRLTLEYYKTAGQGSWVQRGTPTNVYLTKINNYWYEVTRTYSDYISTYYNVTYTVKADEPIKITITVKAGQTDQYRLAWALSGITQTVYADEEANSVSRNYVTYGQESLINRWIRFDWNDAKNAGYSCTPTYSTVAQGRKASLSFALGTINSGQTKIIDPSTVGTSTVASGTRLGFQRKTWSVSGLFWVSYSDGTNAVYRTSADGITWSAATTMRGGLGFGEEFSVFFDGTYIHYAAAGWSQYVYYRRGTCGTDGTITWSAAEQTIVDLGASWENYHPSIITDTSGYPFIAYCAQYNSNGTMFTYVNKASTNDGTWSTASGFPALVHTPSAYEIDAMFAQFSSGKVLIVYVDGDSICHSKLWGGVSWGVEKSPTDVPWYGSRISLTANGGAGFFAYQTGDLKVENYDVATDAWAGSPTTIQASISTYSSSLCADVASGQTFIFWYSAPTAGHIYYKRRSSGGTWDASATDWIDESTDTMDATSLTAFYQSASSRIGIAYQTKSGSPYNIRFAYVLPRSTTSSAIAWGGMTHQHYDGTRYWTFYRDGTSWLAEVSDDGILWGYPPITLVASFTRPVAFYCVGTTIHMVYGDYASRTDDGSLTVHTHYRRGVISGTSISLDAERTLHTWTSSFVFGFTYPSGQGDDLVSMECLYYDVTVGTDNLITVAFFRKGYLRDDVDNDGESSITIYSWRYVYDIIKSTATDGSTWGSVTEAETPIYCDDPGTQLYDWNSDSETNMCPDDSLSDSTSYLTYNVRPRLAPLASGVVVCFVAKDGALSYHKSSAWTSFTSVDATIKNTNEWGSLAGGNGGGKVGLAILDSDDTVDVHWYDGTTLTSDADVLAATRSCPTITSTNSSGGTWYLAAINSTQIMYKVCTAYDGTWDPNPTNLVSGITSPASLSSARIVYNGKLLFLYQSGSGSPYDINFGALTLNSAPSNDGCSFHNLDDTDNIYAQKQNYILKVNTSDTDGYADFVTIDVTIQTGGATERITFRYTEGTDTFSELSGDTSKWTLTTGSCISYRSGNDVDLSFYLLAEWDATEESDLDVKVVSTDAASTTDTDTYDLNVDVVTRLVTSSVAAADSRINLGGSATIMGTVYYANDPASNTASTSYPPDAEFTSVAIHDAAHSSQGSDVTIVNGAFSVAFSIPSTVQSNTYHVYLAMADASYTDADAPDGDTVAVVGDRIRVLTLGLTDSRINADGSATAILYATADLEYDSHALGAGDSLTISGIALSWDAGDSRFEGATATSSSVTSTTYNAFTSGSEATYGITSGNINSLTVTLVYDKVQAVSYARADDRADINTNVFVNVSLRYAYDSTAVTDGTVTVNSLSANHLGSGVWRFTSTSATIQLVTYNTVAASGNTYGITAVDQNGQSITIVFDRLTVAYKAVDDDHRNVNTAGEVRFRICSEYDNAYVTGGSLTVNGSAATYDAGAGYWKLSSTSATVTKRWFIVDSVSWNLYAITALNTGVATNSTSIIYDQVDFYEWGTTDSDSLVGRNTAARVYIKARYAYDLAVFTSNAVSINSTAATYSVADGYWYADITVDAISNRTFSVTSFTDATYDLTASTTSATAIYVQWTTITIGTPVIVAASGTYQTQLNVPVTWAHNSTGVDSGIFTVTESGSTLGTATSSAGNVSFTLTGTLHGTGTLTITGSKSSITPYTTGSINYAVGIGSWSATAPTDWNMGTSKSIPVSFVNTANVSSTPVGLESIRLRFEVLSGSTSYFAYNASSFNLTAGATHSTTYSMTLTGIASSGSYTLRITVYQLGSEWTLKTQDYTVYVSAPTGGGGSMPSGGGGTVITTPGGVNVMLSVSNFQDSLYAGETKRGNFAVTFTGLDQLRIVRVSGNSSWISYNAPNSTVASPISIPFIVTAPLNASGPYLIVVNVVGATAEGVEIASNGYIQLDVVNTAPAQEWTNYLPIVIAVGGLGIFLFARSESPRRRKRVVAKQMKPQQVRRMKK